MEGIVELCLTSYLILIRDMLTTAIFQSDSKESAEQKLENESCNRL